MNNQEAFDTIVSHLRKQNARSMDSYWCCYRGKGGLKCAVGCLIPDKIYNPLMEDFQSIIPLLNKWPALGEILHDVDVTLLRVMQNVHDIIDINNWEENFVKVSKEFELKLN